MKKLPTLAISLLAIVTLSGCGAPYQAATGDMATLAIKQYEAQSECAKAYQEAQKIDCSKLSEMNCMFLQMQQQNIALVGAATGKMANPCGAGTNLFDVMKEEVAQKNATVRSVTGSAAGVVKFGLGVWGATEVVDSIGKNAGSTSNVDTNGGDSSISTSRTQTETNTHSTASNTGEEGVSTTNPTSAEPVFTDPAVDPIITAE